MRALAAKTLVLVASLSACVALSVCPIPVRAATHAQIRELSQHLVNDVLKARAGDVVHVTSSPQNLELLEDLWLDLHKVGAFSIVRLQTERMSRLFNEEVPAKYDSATPVNVLGLAHITTAEINIDYDFDPTINDSVAPSRAAAWNKAYEPVALYMLKHNEPFIEIGNGLYPSKYTAQQYGIGIDRLAELFWNGVNVNPAEIQSAGQAIRSALGPEVVVHVTAPNGTDVSFRASAQSTIINNGTISDAARRKGGAALNVSLPAGDVTFIPVHGSAAGVLVSGPQYYNSTKVVGLTFHLSGGKITAWSASSGRAVIDKIYASGGLGRDEFSYADIGTNPKIHFVAGTNLFATMAGGMFSFGVGNNISQGGSNAATLFLGGYIPNSTITIGGKMTVKDGELTI